MSKYDRYENANVKKQQPWKVHPIWRGIGCIMLIIIPIIAWAGAVEFMRIAPKLTWFPQSSEMYRNVDLQYFVLPASLGQIIFTILFMMLGFVIMTIAYSFVYRIAGPPKYGPTDAPPPRVTRSRRRK